MKAAERGEEDEEEERGRNQQREDVLEIFYQNI